MKNNKKKKERNNNYIISKSIHSNSNASTLEIADKIKRETSKRVNGNNFGLNKINKTHDKNLSITNNSNSNTNNVSLKEKENEKKSIKNKISLNSNFHNINNILNNMNILQKATKNKRRNS